MRVEHVVHAMMSAGLIACSANAAIDISAVGDGTGYDEPAMSGFRSTGVAKSFDVDGDDVYDLDLSFLTSTGTPERVRWMRMRPVVGNRQVAPREGGRPAP